MSNDVQLTRSAKKLLFLLCEHYKTRIRYGTPEDEASYFGGAEQIVGKLGLSDSVRSVSAWADELICASFLTGLHASNILVESNLNPSGLAYYEHRYDSLFKAFSSLLASASGAKSLLE